MGKALSTPRNIFFENVRKQNIIIVIIIIIILLFEIFSHLHLLKVFHRSLSDSKSQVSRTLLSILADLNNAVVWIVSTSPVISKSSSPCTNLLVTVPRAKGTNYNWYNGHFHVPQFF